MKDFRYHVVSLAAVFLALAVGILMGAGPLQSQLSNALGGKVGTLQERNDRLSAQLESARTEAGHDGEFIKQWSGQVNAKLLDGKKVGIVVFPGVNAGQVQVVGDALRAAGATVAGTAQLGNGFISKDTEQYRASLAAQLGQYLDPKPDASASPDAILSAAVGSVLVKGPQAATISQILGAKENALATFADAQGGADSFVVITGAGGGKVAASPSSLADLVASLGSPQIVVIGDAADAASYLALIREQGAPVTSIDSFPAQRALASIAPALLTANGAEVALGSQSGASTLAPQLPR